MLNAEPSRYIILDGTTNLLAARTEWKALGMMSGALNGGGGPDRAEPLLQHPQQQQQQQQQQRHPLASPPSADPYTAAQSGGANAQSIVF
jgi:hypothetical protein